MTKIEICTFSSPDGEVLVPPANVKGRLSNQKMKLLSSSKNYIFLKLQTNGPKCKKTITKSQLNEIWVWALIKF